mmetsp:Transcript_5354/g.6508  ORF Transcript_5354/g.6508 Transcript_5354/m.6508 type:complete len:121 (-) Transcript_5354:146-508(-)
MQSNSFPDELWVHIFRFLSPTELTEVELVCKDWRELAKEEDLWKTHLQSLATSNKHCQWDESADDIDYKSLYKDNFIAALQREGKRCPACCSSQSIPICYGYPSKRAFELVNEGKIILGG